MIVNTRYGAIEGITENGCEVFKGIPYARPPIGALRFRKPQKPDSWTGVYRADHFRCKSMQAPPRPGFYRKEFYSDPNFVTDPSEDCLYLNIWIPLRREEEKLPVGVYVHGGAFMGGAGSNLPFVCNELAKEGVIIVTINYRLGALGFLCHPLLGVEGENQAGGNYGLWDQLEALRWVKENIESFGGDAGRITAFGQSAGAMSLQALALTKQAENLLSGMILQSGGGYENPLSEYRSIEKAARIAEDLLKELGIPEGEWLESAGKKQQALERLQGIPMEKFMEAVDKVTGKSFAEKAGIPFVPVIDGELLTKDGNQLIEEGRFLPIHYMLGANRNDLTTEGEKGPAAETNLMHRGNVSFAQLVNEDKKNRAYVYYFTRQLPGDESGAFHSGELWYVFGSLEYGWRPWEPEDYALSEEMRGYWSRFMKTGDPNKAGSEDWQACTKEKPYYQILDVGK